jgi:hypothetical protein
MPDTVPPLPPGILDRLAAAYRASLSEGECDGWEVVPEHGKAELRRIALWMLDHAGLTEALARGVTAEVPAG